MSELDLELGRLRKFAQPEALPYASDRPVRAADFRVVPEDFRVLEHGIAPGGVGEHLLLRVRKRGQNTRWVAQRLAEYLELPYRMVSYAGLKDRNAVTEQWFSAHMPGRPDPDLGALAIEGVEVLATAWHDKKLRPGELSYNEFDIRLRNCADVDPEQLQAQLDRISESGVPNYFGPQRFGREGGNLDVPNIPNPLAAMRREQRSFVISALRGGLFNGYLAQRVAAGSWNVPQADESTVSDRPRGLAQADTSVFDSMRLPAGLLWGNPKGVSLTPAELEWYGSYPEVTGLLTAAGSRAARRVLVCRVAGLRLEPAEGGVRIGFKLGPGAYATTVLREIFNLINKSEAHEK